jgi:endonuclease/exonuclease/phosphatase family metal-dependent hydrolase
VLLNSIMKKYLLIIAIILLNNSLKAQTTTSTIEEARKIATGKAVTVAGRVTATNQFGSTAYIQDGTAGIAVFSTLFANGVAIGDSVKVSGLMSAFNAQLQIGTSASIVDFTKINVPNKPVAPKTITIAQAKDFESQLVTIKDIEFVDKKFIFVPNSNYPIFSGTQTPLLDLRIVNTTNLVGRSKPQSKVAATGIMGLFYTTFQLQPRFIDDLPTTEAFKKPSTGLATEKSFKLATWNTNWLGNTSNGPTNEALQQRNFQQVLDSLKADVYVLEEVSNLPVFNAIVAKNTNYKGFCTTAISAGGVATDAQRVCFMYKKGVIDSVSARPLLTKATTLANYPENNPARFWASGRLPFLFIADATIDGVKKRLHIIGIHARANTGGTSATLAAKELQYAQRKYDVEVLKDTLDIQFPNANIILAGDYNDDVDETVSEITSTKESSYKKFVDDTKNYQVITKHLSDNGFRSYLSFNNVIDHITVSNELIDNYVVNSASPEMGFLYITNYASTTSDHLPIYTTFNFEIKSPTELTAKSDTYDKATLTWKDNTNNETGFEIERSTDGTTFAKVADAAVNVVTFTNENLKDGVKYFYRLRTITPEGKSKYSNIAEITTVKILASEPLEGDLFIQVFPNPTTESIKIQAIGKSFDFSLTNLSGKSILENSGDIELVNKSLNGKLSSLPQGVYILKMQTGEKNGVLKIIKE